MFDGALCICNYIETTVMKEKVSYSNCSVIELGAGCGLPGILLAALGAKVCLTDIAETVELIEENIENNETVINQSSSGSATAKILDWTEADDIHQRFNTPVNIVLAADTVYSKDAILPFIKAAKALSGPNTVIIFAHPAPREPAASEYFWSVVHEHFQVEKVSYRFSLYL